MSGGITAYKHIGAILQRAHLLAPCQQLPDLATLGMHPIGLGQQIDGHQAVQTVICGSLLTLECQTWFTHLLHVVMARTANLRID